MPRPSKVDRLPAEIRELIGELRGDGRTIDEILAKLRELKVELARSTLGRHVQELDALGEQIRKSRAIAEALVARFGDAPESRTARLNIELMHGQVMKLLAAVDPASGETVSFTPREVQFLSDALHRLSRASKDDVDREEKTRALVHKEIAEKAKAAAETIGDRIKARGGALDPETLRTIREEIYGIVA